MPQVCTLVHSLTVIEATWDSPPKDSDGWASFERAFTRYVEAKDVVVPTLTREEAAKRDNRAPKQFKILSQPEWNQGTHLQLRPFQVLPSCLEDVMLFKQVYSSKASPGCGRTGGISSLASSLTKWVW